MSVRSSIWPGLTIATTIWFGAFGLLLILDRTIGADLGGPIVAYTLSFAILCCCIMGCALALSGRWADRGGVYVIGLGLAVVVLMAASNTADSVYGLLAGYGLLLACTSAGALVGRRVEDAGYLWPLTIVMVSFDLWSVFAAAGVTQELVVEPAAEASRALLVLSFPVSGMGVQPVLGIGDVIVVSMFYATAHWLELSSKRLSLGLGIGFVLCLVALIIVQVPLPALAFIAPCGIAALGAEVKPRLKDIIVAVLFCVIGILILDTIRS